MTTKQDTVIQNELHPEPAPTVKLDWELQHPAIDDGEDDADPEIVQDYLNGQFALMFMNAGGNEKRSRCKALRAVARSWEGTRKEFVAAAAANGVMPGTASTQWQAAKTHED